LNLHHHFRSQEILRFYIHFHHSIRKKFFEYIQSAITRKFTRASLNLHQIKTSTSHLSLPQQLLPTIIMTYDVKSVESWTTHLLRSTVNRRVSLLLIDVSVKAEEATTSWNIKNKKQLCQWVTNQLNQIIDMLNKLRSQWDLTLQLNEHWILVQDDHKKRAKQLEVAFEKNDELEEKINQLQSERLNFKAKQRQADQPMSRQETQSVEHRVNQKEISSISEVDQRSRSSQESFTLFNNRNDHHKSIKFLNSSIFIDTDESTWESWIIKISDKLDVNANHYSIEKLRIVYVTFRLNDDADEQIYAKHRIDAFSLYLSLTKLLKHLNEIYDDQNRNRKCRHEYNALKQSNKSFSFFYFKFTKIFSFLDYDDWTLMNDLQNKINNHLQNVLSVCLIKFSSLDKLKTFLQRVNNKQWVNYQLHDEQWTVKSIAASKKRFVSSSTSVSVSTTSYVQLTTFFIFESEWSRMSIICFNCKVSSHLSKNCSQLKTSTLTSHAFISRLNEIIMSKEEKKLFTEKSKNEAKN